MWCVVALLDEAPVVVIDGVATMLVAVGNVSASNHAVVDEKPNTGISGGPERLPGGGCSGMEADTELILVI